MLCSPSHSNKYMKKVREVRGGEVKREAEGGGRREEERVEVNIYADSAGVIRNVVNLTSVDFILKTTTTANYSFWNYSTALFQQTILHMYPSFFLPPPFPLFMDISVFSKKSLM